MFCDITIKARYPEATRRLNSKEWMILLILSSRIMKTPLFNFHQGISWTANAMNSFCTSPLVFRLNWISKYLFPIPVIKLWWRASAQSWKLANSIGPRSKILCYKLQWSFLTVSWCFRQCWFNLIILSVTIN